MADEIRSDVIGDYTFQCCDRKWGTKRVVVDGSNPAVVSVSWAIGYAITISASGVVTPINPPDCGYVSITLTKGGKGLYTHGTSPTNSRASLQMVTH